MLKGKIMSAVVLMDIMGHVVTTEVRFNYLVLITIIRAIVCNWPYKPHTQFICAILILFLGCCQTVEVSGLTELLEPLNGDYTVDVQPHNGMPQYHKGGEGMGMPTYTIYFAWNDVVSRDIWQVSINLN